MTEAELFETIGIFLDLSFSALEAYLTLTSAYLITAYIVGAKLTKIQLTILNSLYIVFSFITVFATSIYAYRATNLVPELKQLRPTDFLPGDQALSGILILSISMLIGILASLYFMFSTRRRSNT